MIGVSRHASTLTPKVGRGPQERSPIVAEASRLWAVSEVAIKRLGSANDLETLETASSLPDETPKGRRIPYLRIEFMINIHSLMYYRIMSENQFAVVCTPNLQRAPMLARHKIIHRDIPPQNILVDTHELTIKTVGDYGIQRADRRPRGPGHKDRQTAGRKGRLNDFGRDASIDIYLLGSSHFGLPESSTIYPTNCGITQSRTLDGNGTNRSTVNDGDLLIEMTTVKPTTQVSQPLDQKVPFWPEADPSLRSASEQCLGFEQGR